jgi:hypothetical protein
MLAGWFMSENPSMTGDDLRIHIDQRLEKCCLSRLGQEKDDLQLIDELLGETMIYVIGLGINRKDRRF